MGNNQVRVEHSAQRQSAIAMSIWEIFHAVVATGDTYTFDPQISREDALAYWLHADTHTYVAEQDRNIVGTYILKANQPGAGAHVANAAFMVATNARGLGIGRAMAEHCLSRSAPLRFSRDAV